MVFGLTYSPKIKLSSVAYDIVSTDEYGIGILSADTVRNQGFSIPNSFGVGVSYEKDHKWIIAADLSYQEWSKSQFFGENDIYKNRQKIVIGSEYIPNSLSRKYLSRAKYRAGFNYSNSYLKLNGFGFNEYGVSFGVGFPMLDNRSFINASFEYIKVVPEINSLINEQYFRFTLSCTFNEYWFFKRRMD
jgi:long-subunit fatty acid transport protein